MSVVRQKCLRSDWKPHGAILAAEGHLIALLEPKEGTARRPSGLPLAPDAADMRVRAVEYMEAEFRKVDGL